MTSRMITDDTVTSRVSFIAYSTVYYRIPRRNIKSRPGKRGGRMSRGGFGGRPPDAASGGNGRTRSRGRRRKKRGKKKTAGKNNKLRAAAARGSTATDVAANCVSVGGRAVTVTRAAYIYAPARSFRELRRAAACAAVCRWKYVVSGAGCWRTSHETATTVSA